MPKKRTGREVVDRFYRELEQTYSIEIRNGEVADIRVTDGIVQSYNRLPFTFDLNIGQAVETLEKTIAKLPALPAPERPAKIKHGKAANQTAVPTVTG